MADNQSREVKDGRLYDPQYAMYYDEFEDDNPKKVGDITVKVNVDVSEALVGLKAVTREAREATKALRELEEASTSVEIDGKAFGKIISDELSKTRTYSKRITGRCATASTSATSAPEHVKAYGKGEGWTNKGKPESARAWFGDSITDDIRRSYE